MAPEDRPRDDDPHAECKREIENLRRENEAICAECTRLMIDRDALRGELGLAHEALEVVGQLADSIGEVGKLDPKVIDRARAILGER